MPDHITLMDCGHYTWGLSNSVDLVCDFASKGKEQEEALRMDEGMILAAWVRLGTLLSTLVKSSNKGMLDKEATLSRSMLRAHLSYDPATGIFTRTWSPTLRGIGKPAGKRLTTGYVQIGIGTRRYQAHRLAWLDYYGEWPTLFVDHANGDRSDNRIGNLRLATRAMNGGNRRPQQALKGITPVVRGGSTRWRAQICVNRKKRHLGLFKTPEEAHAAYAAAAKEAFGKFARTT